MSSEAVKLRLHIGCTHISVEGGPEEAKADLPLRVDDSGQDEHSPSAGRGGARRKGGGAIGEDSKGEHHGVVGEPLPVAPGVGQIG